MKKSLIILSLIMSPAAFAQYAGTIGDLNTIYNPPSNIQGIICDGAASANAGPHDYKACSDGVASARYMAEKYAAGAGKFLGCVDGFYQGVNDGYADGIKPTAEMLQQAQDYVKNATFTTALTRAETKASSEARTESADQIVGRYRQVVGVKDASGNQVLPDKSYKWPTITFFGFEDGYENDLAKGLLTPIDFSGPTNAGWINSATTFDLRIAAAKAYALQPQYAQNLCDISKTIFGRRNMRQLTIWDYFHQLDENFYKDYGWNNGEWSWDYFLNEERNLDLYQNYIGISNLTKKITVTTQVPIIQKQERPKLDAAGNKIPKIDPATGLPLKDALGNIIYQTELVDVVVGYNPKTEDKIVPLDANDIKKLQATYRKGFIDAYNFHFARAYASLYYNVTGMEKYGQAKLLGQVIGEEVARHTANKIAYNGVYKANSASKYAEVIKHLYKVSFDRLISIFASNPVVDLNDSQIIGTVNDDIFRAGEELRAYFDITNLGEVTRPVTLSLASSSDVFANPTGFSITPPVLERMTGQTPVLGKIASDRMARSSIMTNFVLNNPSDLAEIKSTLNTSKGQSLGLSDYAEINKVDASLNPMTGSLDVQVQLTNPSSVESPAFPSIQIVLDGQSGIVIEKTVEKILPKGTLVASLGTTQLDPIAIIASRRVSGTINVKLANRVVHTAKFSAQVDAAPNALLAAYFHNLIMGKVSNTGNQNVQDRIVKLIEMIDNSVDYVLANDIIKWRKQWHVDRTIVGDLQKNYATSMAANELTPEAQKQYTSIALMLAKKVNNKGATRIRGLDKHYLKALQRFAPTISTKWRHYR